MCNKKEKGADTKEIITNRLIFSKLQRKEYNGEWADASGKRGGFTKSN